MQALIAKIDIPVRQVLIEARIVEADDTFGRSLGVRLGGSDLRGVRGGDRRLRDRRQQPRGARRQHTTRSVARRPADRARPALRHAQHHLREPAGHRRRAASTPSSFALSLFSAAANRFLNLELSALEADGKGKVVSSPRVDHGRPDQGADRAGRRSSPTSRRPRAAPRRCQFRKANLKLEVTPQITPEGNIILDVDINKDSRGETTAAGFAINTKHVKTQVLVENGGTVVIGGIFEQTERENDDQGAAAGRPARPSATCSRPGREAVDKTEMLIFLTPKIVTDRRRRAERGR